MSNWNNLRLLASTALVGFLLLGCCEEQHYAQHWDQLRTGMTKDEVRHLLGTPSCEVKSGPAELSVDADFGKLRAAAASLPAEYSADLNALIEALDADWWGYGGVGMVPIFPPCDAYVLHFDADGKLLKWRKPMVLSKPTSSKPS